MRKKFDGLIRGIFLSEILRRAWNVTGGDDAFSTAK